MNEDYYKTIEQAERNARLGDLQEAERLKEKAREEAKKNKDPFTQVDKQRGWRHMRLLIKESPLAAEIFTFLAEKMDRKNAVVCSQQVLIELTGKSRQSVSKATKLLKDKGYIHVYKSGTSNAYVLNPDLLWESYDYMRPYCEFPATVILSKKENEEQFKELELQQKRINEVSFK